MSQSGVHQINGGDYCGDIGSAPAKPEGLSESRGRIQAWSRGGGVRAGDFGCEAGAEARRQHEPVVQMAARLSGGEVRRPGSGALANDQDFRSAASVD